jgi:serine/threonine protein phosphatase PrpC
MGGQSAGEAASRLALTELADAVQGTVAVDAPLRTGILNGIERANSAIKDLGVGAATTLAVVEAERGCIRPYHVGDSMVLVAGQRGKVKLQTVSHSPVGYAVESGLLSEREALHHEDRHLVSNAVGSEGMRIEVGPVLKLRPRDTVVLASDGLFDNLHTDEIVRHVRKGPLLRATQGLVVACGERMRSGREGVPSKPDDLTCIVFRLDKVPHDNHR